MKVVAIVSGGMDSVTLAHCLKKQVLNDNNETVDLHLLSFNYGQRHAKELMYAAQCAADLEARFDIIDVQQLASLFAESGSVLVSDNPVPDGHYAEDTMKATVVPNRNSIMLSIAVGVAVSEQAAAVAAGMHAGDHFIYPDCRPDYFMWFSRAMQEANEGFWDGKLIAPFLQLTKAEIARLGADVGVDFSQTWSCYKGGEFHCGKCGTCTERKEAFALAGVKDPTIYEA